MSFSYSNDPETGKEQQTERFIVSPDSPGKLKVQQQTWAVGMGWFTQKSMTLTEEQASMLGRELEYSLNLAKMARTTPQKQTAPEAKPTEPVNSNEPLIFPNNRQPGFRSSFAVPLASEAGNILQFRPRTKRA